MSATDNTAMDKPATADLNTARVRITSSSTNETEADFTL
jgi:hypothetical protein